MVGPLIRNLGSMLVRGVSPREVFMQYMARGGSPTGGKDCNLHFGDLSRGLVSPISMLGALIPVAPLLVSTQPWAIWTSFAVAMLSHFAVGAARSAFTGRGLLRSGMDMFLVGLGVAVVGYLLGDWIVGVL